LVAGPRRGGARWGVERRGADGVVALGLPGEGRKLKQGRPPPDEGPELEALGAGPLEQLPPQGMLVRLGLLDAAARRRPDDAAVAVVEAHEQHAVVGVEHECAYTLTQTWFAHPTRSWSARNQRSRSSHATAAFPAAHA